MSQSCDLPEGVTKYTRRIVLEFLLDHLPGTVDDKLKVGGEGQMKGRIGGRSKGGSNDTRSASSTLMFDVSYSGLRPGLRHRRSSNWTVASDKISTIIVWG